MLRAIALLVVVLVSFGCGGGGEEAVDPASLETCRAVADAAIVVIQDSIDMLDAASTSGTEPDAETVAAVEAAGTALEERALALACTDAEMSDLMAGLASGLEAESVFGQLIIESLRAGDGGFFEEG